MSMMLMVLLSVFFVLLYRSKMLQIIIGLELCSMGLFGCLVCCLVLFGESYSLIFFFLVLSVCEASLGLNLVVGMSRSAGGENFL